MRIVLTEEENIRGIDKKEYLSTGNSPPDSRREADNKQDPTLQSPRATSSHQTTTEDMEVHKHPHHVTHKKKWLEYFLEFLMLFLAVFLGFLAEYRLEHKIEKDKEEQYIQSLVEDLSTDTASLRETISNFNIRGKNLDTLLSLFPRLKEGYDHKLHEKLHALTGFADFVKADRTMQQLKNSGGMRLIQNKKAADGITNYDLMNRDLDIDVSSLQDIFYRVMVTRFEIIDSEALEKDIKTKKVEDLEAGKKNYLLKSDQPALGKFNNEIREFRVVCEMVKNSEIRLRKQAVDLITLLKKEYHIHE